MSKPDVDEQMTGAERLEQVRAATSAVRHFIDAGRTEFIPRECEIISAALDGCRLLTAEEAEHVSELMRR
jgi:hypothetical protein